MSIIKCCFDVESELLDSISHKCARPGCCCGCYSALRPRYKNLVDNIFPVLPQDGLVKNNMEKLTFYALSSPEKLDRIGEYLYQKAGRDIYRRKYGFVVIAMEAMDQLLLACHAQTLNLFVESFLKMVQKLLESTEPQLQIMATQSFVRFANIEEDAPSYHRRYDFFVSKFASMCHHNDDNPEIRDSIRLAGIRGLQGVVRKTVSDDLAENIWESVHMDKIVPSLLFNMQNSRYSENESSKSGDPSEVDSPPSLSESCLRELVGRASFGHIRSVLRPVLRHLDLHELWVPNHFAIHTFEVIMFSVQAQYSYAVIESLMKHLDENSKANPKIKTSIAEVLSKIIAVAAEESVGPSVLEIINSLLTHLRTSVSSPTKPKKQETDEKLYQEALINALGEFANHLPDYQKIEIMMFIMSKVPIHRKPHDKDSSELLLENILLKSLLKVGTKYQTIHFNTTFPLSFLNPLLRMSLAPDPEMRVLVQKIFHTLIDRHDNLEKLLKPTIHVSELELRKESSSRPDLIFIRKHGPEIFTTLYESLEMGSNTTDNYDSVYTTIALLTVEVISEDTMMDLIRLLLSLQDMTMTTSVLTTEQKAYIHAIVISAFVLIPNVVHVPCLLDYAESVIQIRRSKYPHFLPDFVKNDEITPSTPSSEAFLDLVEITEQLKLAGFDVVRLLQTPGYVGGSMHRHSWVESGFRTSISDLNACPTEVDSVNSSPGFQKRHPEEQLTFDSLKKILLESMEVKKLEEEERRSRITKTFRSASFEELIKCTQSKPGECIYAYPPRLGWLSGICGTRLAPLPTKPLGWLSCPPPGGPRGLLDDHRDPPKTPYFAAEMCHLAVGDEALPPYSTAASVSERMEAPSSTHSPVMQVNPDQPQVQNEILQKTLGDLFREEKEKQEVAESPENCIDSDKPRAYEVFFPELFVY